MIIECTHLEVGEGLYTLAAKAMEYCWQTSTPEPVAVHSRKTTGSPLDLNSKYTIYLLALTVAFLNDRIHY